MPASDALHMKTTMVDEFDRTWFKVLLTRRVELQSEAVGYDTTTTAEMQDSFGEKMKWALQASETFYVSPDMVDLALRASEDFPLDEKVMHEDLPAEVGFMRLAKPLLIEDVAGFKQNCHAILWSGPHLWIIGDRLDPTDEISIDVLRKDPNGPNQYGRYDIIGLTRFRFGEPIPYSAQFSNEYDIRKYREGGYSIAVSNGRVVVMNPQAEKVDIPYTIRRDPTIAWLLSVWRLMQQTLSTVDREVPPRGFRKRAQHLDIADDKVSVISLRRREQHHHYDPETANHINYRTPVRGHWRKVWCGPRDGERYQRAVYVDPFWRGPEGAPIIVRKRVNALIR
jgi:hypothetical protein